MNNSQKNRVSTVLLFSLILNFLSIVDSQRCEAWKGEPSICGPILNKLVSKVNSTSDVPLIFVVTNQIAISEAVARSIYTLNTPLIPASCRSIAIEYYCLSAFRSCNTVNDITPPYAPLLCKSLCNEFSANCGPILQQFKAPLLNCSLEAYPEKESTVTINGENVTLPCVSGDGYTVNVTTTSKDINCGPLAFDSKAFPPCSETCLSPILTPKQWKTGVLLTLIFGWLSIAITSFMLMTYILQRDYLYPKNMHIFCMIGVLLIAISMVTAPMHDYTTGREFGTFCKDSINRNLSDNAACTLQGLFLFVGGTIAYIWWLFIAIYLYVSIQIPEMSNSPRLPKISYIVAFGWTTIMTIITLASQQLGFNGTTPWCFFSGKDGHVWEIVLFYGPALLVTLIGLILVVHILIKLLRFSCGMRNLKRNAPLLPPGSHRILMFMILHLILFTFIYANRFSSMASQDGLKAEFREYMDCFLKKQFYTPEVKCVQNAKVSKAIWYTTIAMVSGMGIMFLPMVLTKDKVRFWVQKIQSRTNSSKSEIPMSPYNRTNQGDSTSSGSRGTVTTASREGDYSGSAA